MNLKIYYFIQDREGRFVHQTYSHPSTVSDFFLAADFKLARRWTSYGDAHAMMIEIAKELKKSLKVVARQVEPTIPEVTAP